MLILSRKQNLIVNLDQVTALYLDEECPEAICADIAGLEKRYVLGKYSTPERAKAVLQEILGAACNNKPAFYMPME